MRIEAQRRKFDSEKRTYRAAVVAVVGCGLVIFHIKLEFFIKFLVLRLRHFAVLNDRKPVCSTQRRDRKRYESPFNRTRSAPHSTGHSALSCPPQTRHHCKWESDCSNCLKIHMGQDETHGSNLNRQSKMKYMFPVETGRAR